MRRGASLLLLSAATLVLVLPNCVGLALRAERAAEQLHTLEHAQSESSRTRTHAHAHDQSQSLAHDSARVQLHAAAKFDGLENEALDNVDPVADLVGWIAKGTPEHARKITVVANNNALNSTVVVDFDQKLAAKEGAELAALRRKHEWEQSELHRLKPESESESHSDSERESGSPSQIEMESNAHASAATHSDGPSLRGLCVFQQHSECGPNWQESGFTLVATPKAVLDSGAFPFSIFQMWDSTSYVWTKAYLCCAMNGEATLDASNQFILTKKCPIGPVHRLGGLLFDTGDLDKSHLDFDRDIDVPNTNYRIMHTYYCNATNSHLFGSSKYSETTCLVGSDCPAQFKDRGAGALVVADPTNPNLEKDIIAPGYDVNPFSTLARLQRIQLFYINGVDRGFYLTHIHLCCTS